MKDLPTLNNRVVVASFSKKKLTDGQLALLVLIKKRIKEKRPVLMEDIKEIYNNHVRRYDGKEGIVGWDHKDNRPLYGEVTYTSFDIDQYSRQWLVTNLGVLILKEKLIAIPAFEI